MTDIPIAFNQSPCVGRCSTTYGDNVCRGCKRFLGEIASWGQYNLQEKASVWRRLDLLAERVMGSFVLIRDADKLEDFLKQNRIRYPAHQSESSWALHCLENFPDDLTTLEMAGLVLTEEGSGYTNTRALKQALQKRLYELANAHKERQEQTPSPSP